MFNFTMLMGIQYFLLQHNSTANYTEKYGKQLKSEMKNNEKRKK
jgi:hypothetical protein